MHGFASGPSSHKGVAVAAHYGARGVAVERLDLRVPSFERMRVSVMIAAVRSALGGERERAVLFGSSLGGLTACRVAEQDARVCALVLLAPALRASEQMRRTVGEEGLRRWQETGWLATRDYAEQREARVHFGLIQDLDTIEARSGGWPDVRVPTLLIHGRRDTTTDIRYSREWAHGKRHVRLVEVEDGHELVDSLARITAEADDFLRPFLGAPSPGARG
ncbi:MAG: YqiA/YcfP family alpha/beta fold hydrolase [Archangium sp.]